MIAALALAAAAFGGTPTQHLDISASRGAGLSWACDRIGAPKLKEIELAFDMPTIYQTYQLQTVLYSNLHRACLHGWSQVVIIGLDDGRALSDIQLKSRD